MTAVSETKAHLLPNLAVAAEPDSAPEEAHYRVVAAGNLVSSRCGSTRRVSTHRLDRPCGPVVERRFVRRQGVRRRYIVVGGVEVGVAEVLDWEGMSRSFDL